MIVVSSNESKWLAAIQISMAQTMLRATKKYNIMMCANECESPSSQRCTDTRHFQTNRLAIREKENQKSEQVG